MARRPRRRRPARRRGDADRPGARRRSSWRASTTTCCRKGQEGARRITYRRLATLADESNLDYDRRARWSTKQERESALEQMDMTMVLEGEYRDVRRFIHTLETAPEFVVIEDVGAGAGREERAADLDRQAVDLLQGRVVMEPAQRTRWIQLGVLGVVLVAVVYFVLLPSTRPTPVGAGRAADRRPAVAPAGEPGRRRARSTSRLDALGKAVRRRGRRPAARRNPFRMGAATPPPAPEGSVGEPAAAEAGRRRCRRCRPGRRRRRRCRRFRIASSASVAACRDRAGSPC